MNINYQYKFDKNKKTTQNAFKRTAEVIEAKGLRAGEGAGRGGMVGVNIPGIRNLLKNHFPQIILFLFKGLRPPAAGPQRLVG